MNQISNHKEHDIQHIVIDSYNNNLFCRICFEEGKRKDFISPCLCKGSRKWVHRNCLDEWRKENSIAFSTCYECKIDYTLEILEYESDTEETYEENQFVGGKKENKIEEIEDIISENKEKKSINIKNEYNKNKKNEQRKKNYLKILFNLIYYGINYNKKYFIERENYWTTCYTNFIIEFIFFCIEKIKKIKSILTNFLLPYCFLCSSSSPICFSYSSISSLFSFSCLSLSSIHCLKSYCSMENSYKNLNQFKNLSYTYSDVPYFFYQYINPLNLESSNSINSNPNTNSSSASNSPDNAIYSLFINTFCISILKLCSSSTSSNLTGHNNSIFSLEAKIKIIFIFLVVFDLILWLLIFHFIIYYLTVFIIYMNVKIYLKKKILVELNDQNTVKDNLNDPNVDIPKLFEQNELLMKYYYTYLKNNNKQENNNFEQESLKNIEYISDYYFNKIYENKLNSDKGSTLNNSFIEEESNKKLRKNNDNKANNVNNINNVNNVIFVSYDDCFFNTKYFIKKDQSKYKEIQIDVEAPFSRYYFFTLSIIIGIIGLLTCSYFFIIYFKKKSLKLKIKKQRKKMKSILKKNKKIQSFEFIESVEDKKEPEGTKIYRINENSINTNFSRIINNNNNNSNNNNSSNNSNISNDSSKSSYSNSNNNSSNSSIYSSSDSETDSDSGSELNNWINCQIFSNNNNINYNLFPNTEENETIRLIQTLPDEYLNENNDLYSSSSSLITSDSYSNLEANIQTSTQEIEPISPKPSNSKSFFSNFYKKIKNIKKILNHYFRKEFILIFVTFFFLLFFIGLAVLFTLIFYIINRIICNHLYNLLRYNFYKEEKINLIENDSKNEKKNVNIFINEEIPKYFEKEYYCNNYFHFFHFFHLNISNISENLYNMLISKQFWIRNYKVKDLFNDINEN